MDGAAATMRRLVYMCAVAAAWQRYDESSDARSRIVEAHASGDANSVAELAQAQLDATGEDGQKPSFNHYLGWARFQRGDLGGARDAFLAAVEHDAHDARSWLHLGASLLSAFQIPAATAAFANANDAAIKTGDGATARDALAKLVKAKAWVADWAGFDYAVEAVAQDASSTEGLGVAHVDERVRLPDLVGDARVVGARRFCAHRREEPEPERHRLQLSGVLEGRRRVELPGVGVPGERLPELLAEV